MPKTRQQKEDTVQVMTNKLGKSKSVVFADYQGLTMAQLQELRKALKEAGAEFSITKNNLLKIALKNNQLTVSDDVLTGPIATLFSYEDEISPIKTLVKAIKDNQIGKIKAGILDGEVMDEYKVNKLAQLPSKDELRGKVVGVLVAPLHGLLNVTQGNLRNLVYALEQIRLQKGGEAS
jgi:large subunit ribosomal protein L10